ncbi:uncharacterized protein SPAPADRAFT_140345 [Spathaspora passalidarum NRRL Y-27907]|uniref:Peroxisomal biogenesis factor 8 n=1 Tax=Spathaspora passalidarum (strain NRRL Y-27907 / 11-Y1) TaxID=619300 RepID=G3ARS1_SPAPN|nr:uncharacterized protein SPAPADRAFT_140345 [Spathaspora passalidarum NRRL Y-27907]EGW31338.1 hypothetical protein SPAPADRAFT_140345 [Spathaspora passalidarum NRRL Y-27907]
MADLYRKLGPQGRALLQQGENTLTFDGSADVTPQELDFLIYELRTPKPDTSVSTVLSYLYNYIPFIKYEHNLRLIISAFLDSPVCFQRCNFEENYLIIEVFKLIADKKLRVSQPTLSIKSFYDIIQKTIVHFQAMNPVENSWKVLPIIAGLFLSNELRNEIYISKNFLEYKWFFRDWDSQMMHVFKQSLSYSLARIHSNEVVYLSLVSLAVVYKKDEDVHGYTQGISDEFIIDKLFELMFTDKGTLIYRLLFTLDPNDRNSEATVQKQVFQKPVIKHLNKLSFLLEAYFSKLTRGPGSEKLISDSLFKLSQFNKQLSHSTSTSIFNVKVEDKASPLALQFWNLMKTLLFSEIIILQGILTRFLTSRRGFFRTGSLEHEYRQVSPKILTNLYYVNFILLSIGQGGFDNYNFVYHLALELVQSTPYFEQLTKRLMYDYTEVNPNPEVLNSNYVMNSKVLFVLGLWENYLQSGKTNEMFTLEIYDTCLNLAREKYNNDIIEASHSVLLFYFSTSKTPRVKECLNYVQLLISQFPATLSPNQLTIAIETVGKKIMSTPSGEEFFDFLVMKCVQTRSGVPIKPGQTGESQGSARTTPDTVREAAILTLVQLLPYFPLSRFLNWLDEIWTLVIRSNESEGKFLEASLWNALGANLDLNRSELAIRWWYNEKKLTSKGVWNAKI